MLLKTVKIATIVSYCLIQVGEHIGAPLIILLYLALFLSTGFGKLISLLVFIALFVLMFTIVKKFFISDKIVIPIALLIISAPPTLAISQIIESSSWDSTRAFQFTFGLFAILSIWLVHLTFNQKKI